MEGGAEREIRGRYQGQGQWLSDKLSLVSLHTN